MALNIKFSIAVLFGITFQFELNDSWEFFNAPFNPDQIVRIEKRFVSFQDTIPDDTIYIGFSDSNLPIAFYREINSGVCLDGVCLPVNLRIYWTVSGNYLGYKLPQGEILTKNQHDPFGEPDYKKLHVLLGDPQSLLANFTLQELTGGTVETTHVDAVSGATLSHLRGYIIQGAAYTTHTLWHITYGPSRDSILRVSSDYVSLPLMQNMLHSKNIQDKVWALGHVNNLGSKIIEMIPQVQESIKTDNFYIKEKALVSLMGSCLPDSVIQRIFYETFSESDFGTKRLIIKYLSGYEYLSPNVTGKLLGLLPGEKDATIGLIFNLLAAIQNEDDATVRQISLLLDHEHKLLSRSAFRFLSSLESREAWLDKKLKEYQRRVLVERTE